MDAIRNKAICTQVVAAYSHCPRKAFLLQSTDERGTPHEYLARIMHEEWNADRIVDGAMHDCDECQNLPRVYD